MALVGHVRFYLEQIYCQWYGISNLFIYFYPLTVFPYTFSGGLIQPIVNPLTGQVRGGPQRLREEVMKKRLPAERC